MFTINQNLIDDFADKINEKEKKSNKVTSLSSSSTYVEYPSAKTVYDELMTVRTVTPSIDNDGSRTFNNVTKNFNMSSIDSSDLEYFEKIVYNITFEDDDFQMFYQSRSEGSNMQIIYFDGTDCYWGEIDNNDDLTKGSLICEGNTIQATLNKDKTVTIGDTITDWDIRNEIRMFGNIDFTYTIYSHKYLDTDYPYTSEYHNFEKAPMGDATTNSVTKEYGYIFLSKWDNPIEAIYTITFNDDDSSYLDFGYKATIYFDGTDCYWGVWDEHYNNVIGHSRICEGNVVQATYLCNDDKIHFPDGNSISTMDNWTYFGDVKIKVRNKILVLEYASNKTYNIENSFNDAICYPSIATLKNYAETKINKVYNISSSSTHTQYPSAKAVKDSLDDKTNEYDKVITSFAVQTYVTSTSGYTFENENLVTIDGGRSFTLDFSTLDDDGDYVIFKMTKTSSTGVPIVMDSEHNFLQPEIKIIKEDSTFNIYDNTTNTLVGSGSIVSIANNSSGPLSMSFGSKQIYHTVPLIDRIYPIGAIYLSVNSVNPSLFIGGTWEQIKDRFLLGSGDTYGAGSTGGSATVTLTSAQSGVPAHSHKYQDYNTTYTLKTTNRKPGTSTAVAYGTSLTSGGGATERTSSNNTTANASQAHNNMPPYLAVYMWERVG